ncbi:tyrosine-protein phosphatase [Runella sp.]|uniref:tyrosine-protein phosphatase n=1 Tax=Runella sp. TaxID=1960881 RepID=UPI003015CA6E
MKHLLFIGILLASGFSYAQDSATVYSPKRAVILQGASNFRDLGGYPTQDGKTVVWGKIYRSADIGKLTDADLQMLQSINLKTVCDFRGPDELKSSPDRLPTGVNYINLPAGSEKTSTSQTASLMSPTVNRDSLMGSFYQNMEPFKARYKPVFDQLLTEQSEPLLFHCTAGKDRTGIGAALILSALGVSKEYVLADYQATDVYWASSRERMKEMMIKQGIPEDRLKSMLAANPAYLQKTFEVIEKQYGSMASYLEKEMELTSEKLAILRKKYTK